MLRAFPLPSLTTCLTLGCALLVGGCGSGGESRPTPVSPDEARSIALSSLSFAEIEVPPHNRPEGAEPPQRIPLRGPWKYAGTSKSGYHKWAMDVPIRPRSLFFFSAQPGMAVTDAEGVALPYDRSGAGDGSWSYNRRKLYIHLPEKGDGPAADAYSFSYPRAVDRERALNFAMSGLDDPATFAWTSIQHDWDARRGLLLPAPGKAAWKVTLPAAAELLLSPGIVAPEILDAGVSDGAALRVEVVPEKGPAVEVWRSPLKVGAFDPVRVDLSRWAGTPVTLRFVSLPQGDTRFDYVFVGEPVVASRSRDPRRVVLVFVDTLRPDHMSLYGYSRDTSAKLDAWAEQAVVFEQARSVAPWTLPSARTVVTGRQPEYYDQSPTLQGRLAAEGWATAMFAGNVYLSANFDMHRDWGMHRVGMFPSAEEVTNDALAWLDAHEGRNALLHVHYMDPHLPYLEPKAYRYLYAGDAQGGLGEEFHLPDVRRAKVSDQATIDYIKDRYDNNIRYATDQIARLLERTDDNDIVIVYADHGEEFWEHRGFEHGHTLFDELMRVPFVLKAPGLDPRRIDAPVSLLDLTPTVLDLLDLRSDGLDGVSLIPVARGAEGADDALRQRNLVFGRPLYGTERWGVLHQGSRKWTTNEGREALYDLSSDPLEKRNLIANKDGSHGAPYREHFAEGLGVPMEVGYRLFPTNRGGPPPHDLVVRMKVPGGVKRAWTAHDPLLNSSAEVHVEGEDLVVATWHAGYRGSRDIYVIPNLPIEQVTHGIEVQTRFGEEEGSFTVNPKKDPGLGEHRVPLGRQTLSTRTVALSFAITPMFDEDARGVTADDPELTEELKAMGYLDED